MSRFSGKQFKGAMRIYRERKHNEAKARQAELMIDGCKVDVNRHADARCIREHQNGGSK